MQIEIHDYSPSWPVEFRSIGARLREAFGADALRIDHIGSTSVPGLGAKDIIDVQVTVGEFNDSSIAAAVEAAGLELRTDIDRDHVPPGTDVPADQLIKRLAKGDRINCHVRLAGRFNQRYALLFRDYLRTHSTSAAAYEEVKRQLANHFVDDIEGYYDVKDPVFDLIMDGAEIWAATSGWQPGPPDA